MNDPMTSGSTNFLPLAGRFVAALIFLMPIFFTGQWDRQLLGMLGLLIAAGGVIWLVRPYAVPGSWWLVFLATFVIGLLGISLTVSRLHGLVLESWLPWLFGVVLFLLVVSWAKIDGFLRITSTWLIMTEGISALTAIIFFLIYHGTRAGGWLGNANALGGYLLWGIFLLLPGLSQKRYRRWTWPVMAVMVLAWFSTLSLTAYVAAVIPLGLWLIWSWPKHTRLRIWLIAASIGLVVLIGVMAGWTLANRSGLLTRAHLASSFAQRQEFIRVGIKMWQAKPWFGWGLGSFQLTLPRYTSQVLEQPRYAHNLYVQMLAETGILGLLGWLIIIVMIGWSGWRAVNRSNEQDRPWLRGWWLGWLAFSLHAGVDFSWQFPAGQVWWWAASGIFVGRGLEVRRLVVNYSWYLRWPLGGMIVWLFWISGRMVFSQQALAEGDRLVNTDNLGGAITAYTQSRKYQENRDNDIRLSRQLWIRRADGDLDQSEHVLDAAIKNNPDDYVLYYSLGHTLLSLNRKDEALQALTTAYALDPLFHPEYAADYARLLVDRGQLDQARAIITRTLKAYQDSPRATAPAVSPALQRLTDLQHQLAPAAPVH